MENAFWQTEKDIKISGFFLGYHYCLISPCQVYRTCLRFMMSSTEKVLIHISPGHFCRNIASQNLKASGSVFSPNTDLPCWPWEGGESHDHPETHEQKAFMNLGHLFSGMQYFGETLVPITKHAPKFPYFYLVCDQIEVNKYFKSLQLLHTCFHY